MAAVQNPALTALTTPIQTAALQVPVRAAFLPPPPPFLEVLGPRDVNKTSTEWVGAEALWNVSDCKYHPLLGSLPTALRSTINACYMGVLGTEGGERTSRGSPVPM